MGERQGEGAVVAKQQRPMAFGIKASHRVQTPAPGQPRRQQLQHRGPAGRVVAGGVHSPGLVQEQGERRGRRWQRLTVEQHLIQQGIGLVP